MHLRRQILNSNSTFLRADATHLALLRGLAVFQNAFKKLVQPILQPFQVNGRVWQHGTRQVRAAVRAASGESHRQHRR